MYKNHIYSEDLVMSHKAHELSVHQGSIDEAVLKTDPAKELQNIKWFISRTIAKSHTTPPGETIQVGLLGEKLPRENLKSLEGEFENRWSIFIKEFGYGINLIVLCIRRR